MSTQLSTVDYLLEQLASAGSVSARKMFGEYGLYYDGKIVALVCDDQFFLKPTSEGRAFLGEAVDEQPAYSGARPSFRIDGERWDDAEWMAELVRVTTVALPMPKPKVKKKG
ncbi:competence protein TfoX [Devosia sp. Root413D1]|uniref:TfoX/Sxy family protein n=1 Tax=Devosia sp. Root413D1 TaxID=1736531 RepID=UPI0006FCD485|nr:TfoX/Sxy family protein [Devosia sp. Root413D1]KQW79157.1 competence protein TfoX [Devosia sp. Root413D1]